MLFANHTPKRVLSVLIALVFVLGAFPAVPHSQAAETKEFKFSNSPDNPTSLSISGKTMTLSNLPTGNSFKFVWTWLSDSKGDKKSELMSARTASRLISLSGLADGSYTLNIYTCATQYGYYTQFASVSVKVSGGSGAFPLSSVYTSNNNTYNANRKDENALKYYLQATAKIQIADTEITAAARSITSGVSDNYKKVLAIHDWVSNNIWYDYDYLYGRRTTETDALGTLKTRRSVCEGFANLTIALCRASGIPAKKAVGYASNDAPSWTGNALTTTNHAWVEAYVNNRWVILDPTWDSANSWEYGKKTDSGGLIAGRPYFDITVANFSIDHRIDYYDPLLGSRVSNGSLISANGLTGETLTIDNSIKKIADYAINNTGFSKIIVPSTVSDIGYSAFAWNYSLTEIVLGQNISRIDEYAFYECPNLTVHYYAGNKAVEAIIKTYPKVKFIADAGSNTPAPPSSSPTPMVKPTPPPTAHPSTTTPAGTFAAKPAPSKVYINGVARTFECYEIKGVTYFKLIDVGTALKDTTKKFAIDTKFYAGGVKTLNLLPGEKYNNTVTGLKNGAPAGSFTAKPVTTTIYVNNKASTIKGYFIGSSSYYLIGDLGSYLGFKAERDRTRATKDQPNGPIVINTNK